MSGRDARSRSSDPGRAADSDSAGQRHGRNTTFAAPVYTDPADVVPEDPLDPEITGSKAAIGEEMDGFHQPTALFDKGEFLGELADLDKAPDTRAEVEAEQPPPPGCRLIVVAGPDIGMEWSFKDPEITIGRDDECELLLADIVASRRHARITLEGARYTLTDLGSGNGTYMNGARIEREVLSSGDEITIGERTLRFVELTEAPPTGAAHPLPAPAGHEPSVGVPAISPDDIAVEPRLPSGDDLQKPPEVEAPLQGTGKQAEGRQGQATGKQPAGEGDPRKPRSAFPLAVRLSLCVVVIAGLLAGGWIWLERERAQTAELERQGRARQDFLIGVELVKLRRCGDALSLFDRVLAVTPDYSRAKEYREHCDREVKVFQDLDRVRALAGSKEYQDALEVLQSISSESAYASEAERLRVEIRSAIADRRVQGVRDLLEGGNLEGARELLQDLLQEQPALRGAGVLREEIEDLERRKRDASNVKPKMVIPPELARAVSLYAGLQISAAIDAAEVAGGPEAATFVARMRRVQALLADAQIAHSRKAAAEILRIAPVALELDEQVSGGTGRVRDRIHEYLADALYLKGIEAYQGVDYALTFKLLSEALVVKPGHALSAARLADLEQKARDLYYEGYALKASDADAARRNFKRVREMTRPENPFHRLAAKALSADGG